MLKKCFLILILLCLPLSALAADEVTIGKQTFAIDAQQIAIEAPRISAGELVKGLKKLENMTSLSITGSRYTPKQLTSIRDTFPQADFYAAFRWNNQDFDTHTTEVALARGDYTIKEIRYFLNLMTQVEKMDLYSFGASLGTMDTLMTEYPNVTFGFRLTIGNGRVRTSDTAFSMLNHVTDTRHREGYFTERLRFCPGLMALDLGHNSISGVSFLQYLPELRVLILADNTLTTEAFEDIVRYCPKLEYLEIFMNKIDDLSAITALKELKHLNICANKLTDASAVLELPQLERCWLAMNDISPEQQAQLREAMPQTHFEFDVTSSTEGGWRSESREYELVREMFQTGVYLPFDEPALQ